MQHIPAEEYYSSLPRKRIAVGVLVFRDKKLLVLEPTYKDEWLIPGGVVEKGESFLEAAQRECSEEIGCSVQIKKLLCIDYKRGNEKTGDAVHVVFLGEIGDQPIKLAPEEIKSFSWVTPEDAQSKLVKALSVRVRAALTSIEKNQPYYCEDGVILF